MMIRRLISRSLTGLLVAGALASAANAQTANGTAAIESPTGPAGTMMLTVFLRHDQSKTVTEITAHLKETGWYREFPPAGVEILSWYVMMGIGQVVTLRLPPEKLRDVNYMIERTAWGGFRTEFYPIYDYRNLFQDQKQKLSR